jgi:hypothetical protein
VGWSTIFGWISLSNASGPVDEIAEVAGYFSAPG